MDIRIIKINLKTFKKYQEELLDIYMEAGTQGPMEQFMDRKEETEYLLDLFNVEGYGSLAFDSNKLIGFILACSLNHDSLLPKTIKKDYLIEKCLYISEMHIHKDYRSKGIGSELMKTFLKDIDKEKWNYLFIRAWKNNVRAIKFYKMFGFIESETIDQKKIKKDRSETFMIKKVYLFQKI